MFITFFTELKSAKLPVTLKEYLTLMEALGADLANQRVEDFYYLSRAALVKDERHLDKFDQVFGHVFKGLELMSEAAEKSEIPEEWLRSLGEKFLSEEDKAKIQALAFSPDGATLASLGGADDNSLVRFFCSWCVCVCCALVCVI